jgi:hypothetical protein
MLKNSLKTYGSLLSIRKNYVNHNINKIDIIFQANLPYS